MYRLLAAVAVASLALLAVVASAGSAPQGYSGTVGLWIKGWGRVDLKSGLVVHEPLTCSSAFCTAQGLPLHRARVVLVEKPYPYYKGWRFAGWSGACRGKQSKCVIKVAHIRPNSHGERNVQVGATFIPVALGLTRGHPIPLGTAARIRDARFFQLRVNSVLQDLQLSPSPPAGDEYFAANVTLTNMAGGARHTGGLGWQTTGSQQATYIPGFDGCPGLGPQPQLQLTYDTVLQPGQSTSGYVCWKIARNDARTLELFFGSGHRSDGTTWFALH